MNRLYFLLAALLIIGCTTPYKRFSSFSLRGAGGYSDVKLGEVGSFRVHFSGNGHTSLGMARDLVLLRDAELSTENGFRYFVIENDDTIFTTETSISGSVIMTITTPTAVNIIKCFNEKPKTDKTIYEASIIKSAVMNKYLIK